MTVMGGAPRNGNCCHCEHLSLSLRAQRGNLVERDQRPPSSATPTAVRPSIKIAASLALLAMTVMGGALRNDSNGRRSSQ